MTMPSSSQPSPIDHPSSLDFASTLDRITHAIESAGMRIFARIDNAAGASEVGSTMPPTVVLLYGHPKGGTPIMLAAPGAALDLPLRVLVRQGADGRVWISFRPVVSMLMQSGVPEALAQRLEPAQALLIQAIQ